MQVVIFHFYPFWSGNNGECAKEILIMLGFPFTLRNGEKFKKLRNELHPQAFVNFNIFYVLFLFGSYPVRTQCHPPVQSPWSHQRARVSV